MKRKWLTGAKARRLLALLLGAMLLAGCFSTALAEDEDRR